MSFGSNVMPPRFGAGRPKDKTVQERIREARDDRRDYSKVWLKTLKALTDDR